VAPQLLVLGDVKQSQYSSIYRYYRKRHTGLHKVAINYDCLADVVPIDEYTKWFNIGSERSSIIYEAILERHGLAIPECGTEMLYRLVRQDLARHVGRKLDNIVAVIYDYDTGITATEVAMIFLPEYKSSMALGHIYPVRPGHVVKPGSSAYGFFCKTDQAKPTPHL
jgi:hypothetical protein